MTLVATPPPPPIVTQPAAYQVSYGVVEGIAPRGTRRLVVRVGSQVVADRPLGQQRFKLRVDLPPRDHVVSVTARLASGQTSTRRIQHVFGLPRRAAPRVAAARADPQLMARVRTLARGFGGTAGVYVQNLTTGAGAAWNARSRLQAASTLKLAIAITAFAHLDGQPAPGSRLDVLVRRMLIESDNASANDVERAFGGSTSGGSALVNALMRSIGLVDSEMYGGYSTDRSPSARIPVRVDEQPAWGMGKRTTAFDLAGLSRALWLASGGRGPLRGDSGVTPAEARYLLYVLSQVGDRGKLGRSVDHLPGVTVLHKAGWLDAVRHDNGLVFWRGGVFVAAVLTYRPSGPGTAGDVLAGKVANAALMRFRG